MPTWRRMLDEYEADLYDVPPPRFFRVERGEVEIKRYEDGEIRLEVAFFGLKLADGETVHLVIDGQPVCSLEIHRGRGRAELSASAGASLPVVQGGAVAEIQHQGVARLRGVFHRD